MALADELYDLCQEMYRLTVIPRRSIDRVREAIKREEDPEPYLQDMEELNRCVSSANAAEVLMRTPACSSCGGTGHRRRSA
jgi:predicted Zn-ribbon and HTH transcriptional regulator